MENGRKPPESTTRSELAQKNSLNFVHTLKLDAKRGN